MDDGDVARASRAIREWIEAGAPLTPPVADADGPLEPAALIGSLAWWCSSLLGATQQLGHHDVVVQLLEWKALQEADPDEALRRWAARPD